MKKIINLIFIFVALLLLGSCNNSQEENPTKLAIPTITLNNNVVSWNTVDNATGYIVSKNNIEEAVQTLTSYTISDTALGDYVIKVKAVSTNSKYEDSDYSNSVTYTIEDKSDNTGNPTNPDEGQTGPVVLTEATLYVVGDSTVSSFSDSYFYPRYGYGTQLSNYFDSKLTVNNLALSGRSSKSYTQEANYSVLKTSIKEGDYLLIGFGHNDEKSDDSARFTDASKPITDETSFKYSLYENYVKLALDAGATPILCTPIVRADSSNSYTGSTAHITSTGNYTQAIIELGEEKSVTVIDLTSLTKEKYISLGYNEAIYYHAMTTGKYEDGTSNIIADTASVDATHLNIYGAKYVAFLVASELKKTTNALGNYVLSDIVEPTKDKDLVSNSNYVVPTYETPDLASYTAPSHFTTISEGWYGTAFGDCGGTPTSSSNGYVAQETSTGVFRVGQSASSNKGKFADAGDGIAFLFKQVDITKNFEITADAKVINTASVGQAGFGLMLRDDCYINQNTSKVLITSNYVAAGFVTSSAYMNALFSREGAAITKENNKIDALYAVDDIVNLKITRLGQSITTEVIYNGQTYSKTYLDFDLVAIDGNYMYVGMFANRGTIVEFTNVAFTITGESQGA